jgi:hypothetical protein
MGIRRRTMRTLLDVSFGRRASRVLAVFVGALATLVLPINKAAAQATVDQHVPFTFAGLVNPCTGEEFSGSGFAHLKVFVATTPKGHVSAELNFENVKGITVTGVRYVVPDQENAHIIFDSDVAPATVNDESTQQFIRQAEDGTFIMGDDFYQRLRMQFTINANGVVTVDRTEFTTECR